MAAKSSSMAFEPTPAISDEEKENSGLHNMRDNVVPEHVGRPSKEVHFSPIPTPSPVPRAQSLATSTVPLLEPISSASLLPKFTQHSKSAIPHIDVNSYIEQSRSLLDIQRRNFERERKTFEVERTLWDAERKILLQKISDLESKLNPKPRGRRRYSNEHPPSSLLSFRADFSLASNFSNASSHRSSSTNSGGPPVWRTPDMGPTVTRVFPDETDNNKKPDLHLPSIAETGISPSLDGALSPPSGFKDTHHSPPVSIPIEKLDNNLDGIILKSTGLPPSIVAKVISPNTSSPHTPSPGSKTPTGAAQTSSTTVVAGALLIPSPPHLKTNAGHTPMAFEGPMTASGAASDISTPTAEQESLDQVERPTRPPHERADSYFPEVSPKKDEQVDRTGAEEPPATSMDDEDKELKGPLAMESQHEEGKGNAFLSELDARLLAEAKRAVSPPKQSTAEEEVKNTRRDLERDDDEGPRLRLKKSTNFGSAFGASDCVIRR